MGCSSKTSPSSKKRRPHARRVCHAVSVFRLLVFIAADSQCALKETLSLSNPYQRRCLKPISTALTMSSYRISSLSSEFRGGGGNHNGNISGCGQNNKNTPQVLLRNVLSSGNTNRSNFKTVTTEKKCSEKKCTTKILQESVDNLAVGNDTETRRQDTQILLQTKSSNYSPFRMYCSCIGIVSIWILTGTLFYSYTNDWPIPQSFFYAVDAGMSIGFCTDVAETKLVSKAFTIVYILLGASVVGGALALFIQDIVEGVVERERQYKSTVLIKDYELKMGKEEFEKFDFSHIGTLNEYEFKEVLTSTQLRPFVGSSTQQLSDDDIDILWSKFDRINDGTIYFNEFAGTYRHLIDFLHGPEIIRSNSTTFGEEDEKLATGKLLNSISSFVTSFLPSAKSFFKSENRIYVVFLAWVLLGVTWGMLDQNWDPITATHFAISALATGGLTAPPVDSNGILPAEPAIFCGCYCLFGIPLMAITFGHFARVLVSDHVAAMEKWALTRPITATDYEIAKRYLSQKRGTKPGSHPTKVTRKIKETLEISSSSSVNLLGLCLSDFIILQLLRQGKISMETINILRKEFESLDTDNTWLLNLEEATNQCTYNGALKRID
mmetsp:Transcript_17191/g.39721  ORF Transcript_17191/g.39721 Transcript_17191/m.39721 type:complete len:608 (+) Transcript_17191:109-1932(+)